MSKEPTRYQLSSKLAYQGRTPAFIQRLQNRVAGVTNEDEDDEYEYDGSGRPPIPRRPSIPERPEDEPGSAEEDNDDESPQIVVLKEGKHLSEREVENEKRKAKGLPPLPEKGEDTPQDVPETSTKPKETTGSKSSKQALSFSSSGTSSKSSNKKRKAVGSVEDDDPVPHKSSTKKKPKKDQKKLLSFGDDA